MSETLVLGGPQAEAVPPSAEVQVAMVADSEPRARRVAATAIEEIMRTDPVAAFEWPSGMTPNRGVSYTAPSGDA
jgi:hypothetical protein